MTLHSHVHYGDATPCRMTGVTLHGVVSPDAWCGTAQASPTSTRPCRMPWDASGTDWAAGLEPFANASRGASGARPDVTPRASGGNPHSSPFPYFTTTCFSGSGFRVPGSDVSGFGFRVPGFRFRVPGSEFRVPGFGFRVPGSEFRVPGFRYLVPPVDVFRVPDSGFRVSGFGYLGALAPAVSGCTGGPRS